MTALASLLLSFAAFAALAMTMDKHHRDLFGAPPGKGRRQLFTMAGWLLLAASALPLIQLQGAVIGMLFWLGLLTASALGVAMVLSYRPRLLPTAGLAAIPLSLCAAALAGAS